MAHTLRHLAATAALFAGSLIASASPAIVWLESDHNFGTFKEETGKVSCTYRGVNTGSEPIAVVSARANCGCTVPRYNRDAIAPGDTLTVEVEYYAEGRPGRFHKKVHIETSDGTKSVLNVRGTVIAAPATLESRYPVAAGNAHLSNRIVPLGSTVKGHVLSGGVNIYNSADTPMIPSADELPAYIRASFHPDVIQPGEQGFLSLTAYTDRTDEWGTVDGSFLLTPDINAPADTIRIATVMTVREDFSKLTPEQAAKAPQARISAESIDFDRISGRKPLKRTFTITNTGGETLLVRRLDTAEKALDIRLSSTAIAPGKSATATVTLRPDILASDAPLNARINIMLNAPATPNASVRVVGTH